MKKLITIVMLLAMAVSLVACGSDTQKGIKVPDVFGISYSDAVMILEQEGFTANAVEADVESISAKLLYPLEKVDKGTVFKVDDYIIDGHGNLTKNYDVFYDGEFVSDDNSVVIYYAKEDYKLADEVTEATTQDTVPETTESQVEPETTETAAPETEATEAQETGMNPEFKAAMDSYEEFMDSYVAFMKKYQANPSDIGLLVEYAEIMSDYADFVEDFESWETDDMTTEEAAYYAEVSARVLKKLAEVAA